MDKFYDAILLFVALIGAICLLLLVVMVFILFMGSI